MHLFGIKQFQNEYYFSPKNPRACFVVVHYSEVDVLNLNVIYMLFEYCAAMYKVITIINNSLQWLNKTIRRPNW